MNSSTRDGTPSTLAGMAGLARHLRNTHASVDDTLVEITSSAVRTVPGAEYAGISLVVGPPNRVESRAPTAEVSRQVDRLQTELGEGPCLQALSEHETVQVADLAVDNRWPRFAAGAIRLGVRSMLSFQLYSGNDNLGALNLHATRPGAFDEESRIAGAVLAAHAAVALIGAQHESQLRSALATRDVIGQAKGMIMERFTIDAAHAFALISRLSQESNVPVVEVARQLVRRERHDPSKNE